MMENKTRIIRLAFLCVVVLTFALKVQFFASNAAAERKTAQSVDLNKDTKAAQGDKQKNTASADADSTDTKTTEDAADASAVITPEQYPIMGATDVTVGQMVKYFESSGCTYPSAELEKGGAGDIQTFCQLYYDEAAVEGVRAEIPFVQAMKETGWLQFQGVCDISQYNFAGMGATGGDVSGASYPDVRTGIRAQIQHLKAYASTDTLKEQCVDTRYDLVTKASAPYVQWLGQQENPKGYGWATDPGYGISIAEMIQTLKNL